MVTTRTLLPNCCEEWILEWGKFYRAGAKFFCLPCGHEWQKQGIAFFIEGRTGIKYTEKAIRFSMYNQLVPVDSSPLAINRCCTQILLKHGLNTKKPSYDFLCPVCYTMWSLELCLVNHFYKEIYTNQDTNQNFLRKEGEVADFLEPLVA